VRNFFSKTVQTVVPIDSTENKDEAMEISNRMQNESFDSTVSVPKEDEIDANIRNAIALRQKKSKVSDFYVRLAELKDRIEVYQQIFLSKQPKYLALYQHHHTLQKKMQDTKISDESRSGRNSTRRAGKRVST